MNRQDINLKTHGSTHVKPSIPGYEHMDVGICHPEGMKLRVILWEKVILLLLKAYAVRCHYNAANFLTIIHQRHPIARPLGRGMRYLLWIQHLIITALNCICVNLSLNTMYRDCDNYMCPWSLLILPYHRFHTFGTTLRTQVVLRIYVSLNWISPGSNSGLASGWHQGIHWTNDALLSIGP